MNIPLILTFSRIVGGLVVLPVLILCAPVGDGSFWAMTCAAIATLFCATDFFDGFYARKMGRATVLGRIIDPVADKVFVIATLISLLSQNLVPVFVVLVIVARELFVSCLREVALEYHFYCPVRWSGKIKTAIQMFFLVNTLAFGLSMVPTVLVLAATLFSAIDYARSFYHAWYRI